MFYFCTFQWDDDSTLYQSNTLSWMFIVLAPHCNNSPWIDIRLDWNTYTFPDRSKLSLLLFFNVVVKLQISVSKSLIWRLLKHTILRTRGDPAYYYTTKVRVRVFNATFNNISGILWWSVLLVKKTEVPGKHHRSATSHWQTLSV